MALPAAVLVGRVLMGSATHQVWVLVGGKVHYVSGLAERWIRRGHSQNDKWKGKKFGYRVI